MMSARFYNWECMYGRAIDNPMLTALGTIATQQAATTKKPLKTSTNYYTNPPHTQMTSSPSTPETWSL